MNKIKQSAIIILSTLLLSFPFTGMALADPTAQVTFILDEELLKKGAIDLEASVFGYFYTHALEFHDGRKSVHVQDSLITFEFSIPKEISILKVNLFLDNKRYLFSPPANTYLIQPQDSLVFRVDERIEMRGKGSLKNTIRNRMSYYGVFTSGTWLTYYIEQGNIKEYFRLNNEMYDALKFAKLEYLQSQRDLLDENVFDYILDECIYGLESLRIRKLHSSIDYGARYQRELLPYVVEEFDKIDLLKKETPGISYAFVQYAMDVLASRYFISKLVDSPHEGIVIDMEKIYESIDKLHVENQVRDQIRTFVFNRFTTRGVNAEKVIGKAIDEVSNKSMVDYLKKLKQKRYDRPQIYPFVLMDVNDKLYTPEIFKDKVVVMDFWFYGCHACSLLHLELKKIESMMSGSEVVFVTVNVDKAKEYWMMGLESKIYTSENSINLWMNNPKPNIASYYEFLSYPQILIIGKDGELVTYNPPRPITDNSRKAFLALLKQELD